VLPTTTVPVLHQHRLHISPPPSKPIDPQGKPNPLSDYQLLLLPQPPRNLHRDLQRRRHDLRRRQRQPLRQRDVHHAVALVDFDPLQSLVGGRVLDVVPGVVREHGRVAGGEVEGAGGGVADEGGGAGGAGEEVEPFFGLDGSLLARGF